MPPSKLGVLHPGSALYLAFGLFSSCTFTRKVSLNFLFLLMLHLYHLLAGMSVVSVCVYRGFWSFRPLALLLLQGPTRFPRSPCSAPVLCLNRYLVFIQGPSTALSSSTHQHCLPDGHLWPVLCRNFGVFIIQRPCSLCCFSKGGQQRCVFGRERCRADTVTDRQSFKIPQSTSPPLFVLVREGTGKITREQSSVCVCLWGECTAWVCVIAWH